MSEPEKAAYPPFGSVPFNLDNIKAAYDATGAKPRTCIWLAQGLDYGDGHKSACGCPGGVFAFHFYGMTYKKVELEGPWYEAILGVTERYLSGFTRGFDYGIDAAPVNDRDDDYVKGFVFGNEVRDAILV